MALGQVSVNTSHRHSDFFKVFFNFTASVADISVAQILHFLISRDFSSLVSCKVLAI